MKFETSSGEEGFDSGRFTGDFGSLGLGRLWVESGNGGDFEGIDTSEFMPEGTSQFSKASNSEGQ